jgi:assimilatory nitrate reductase catalytic subunit
LHGVNVLSRGIVGDLGGELVVASPLYKQHFSLITGRCLEEPEHAVPVYLARIHEGQVWVRAEAVVTLFNGLLNWLAHENRIDHRFVAQHTRGAAHALLVAENTAGDVDAVARTCRVERQLPRDFYALFAGTERVVTAFSQGVNQSSTGTDKANSIINAHLLTGRIGRPGMGPFSLTGQPNAMGGREVGGMANMLAAHMDIENPGHRDVVRRLWQAPRLAQRPGLKAVDMFEAMHDGRIKAVWIIATNPVVSLPNADRAREALKCCELVVVSDCVARTDTAVLAHVLLPAAAWGEKDGTVTNSDRHISRQRVFLPLPGAARPDWWMVCEVARRLGFEHGFEFTSPAQIFDEHARLSCSGNDGSRAFDLAGMTAMSAAAYEHLAPVPWPVPVDQPGGTARLFGDGRFYHSDRRARLIGVRPRALRHAPDEEYPLVLNTGRIRDQWHGMTRTGRSPRRAGHLPEPFVDMHPADALGFGLGNGALVRVATRRGRMVARLRTSGEIARRTIFVPIHWNGATASDARVGALVNPAVDAISGEPEFKFTPARVEPFVASWHGFILTRRPIAMEAFTWWASAAGQDFQRYEVAGRRVPGDWSGWASCLLGAAAGADWLEYTDPSAGTYRAVHLQDERLESCVFIGTRPELPSRAWLASLFAKSAVSAQERAALLSGKPANPAAAAGATVCACFNVGRNSIEAAIHAGCRDTASLGARLKAGTNCGSCVPELQRMLAARTAATATA